MPKLVERSGYARTEPVDALKARFPMDVHGEQPAPPISALATATRDALSPRGALAQADPGFVEREPQLRLADAMARAIEDRATLVAEAGTGVGKTFAYLVPLLLSGRRALVSTATKSLQDQLFLRDLPRLREALGLPVRIALLKGRSSYLCLHRLVQARETGSLPDRFAVRALARVETWSQSTRTGDLAEIDGLDDRSPVIPLVTSTRDTCLGGECPQFSACMSSRPDAKRWRPTWWWSTTICSLPICLCATAVLPSCCRRSMLRYSTRPTNWSRPVCSSSARCCRPTR